MAGKPQLNGEDTVVAPARRAGARPRVTKGQRTLAFSFLFVCGSICGLHGAGAGAINDLRVTAPS